MAAQPYEIVKKNFLNEIEYLRYMGDKIFIYPFVGRNRNQMICYGIIYALVLITSIQLFTTLCFNGFSDWFEIINVAPNLGVVMMTVLKYSKMQIHQGLYEKIFSHFRDDLWDVVSDSEDHRTIVSKYTDINKFVTRFLFYYSVLLVIVVNSFPRLIMYYENEIAGKELQYLYPFDGWYPFDKIKWYYAAYFWESFMTFIVVCIYGFANMIHVAYTGFICMELKVLGNSIECLITEEDVNNVENKMYLENTHINIKRKLKTIIIRHQLLAKLSSDLDEILGDGMLLNYFFGAVFICLTIFTATVVDNTYKSVRYFFMFCSLNIEIFYQCMIGQVLSDHSGELANSIYSADWPYADTETNMMLLILMTRTQRPFEYTANGYLNMNLDTYSGICSLSYQLFNLLRTAYT